MLHYIYHTISAYVYAVFHSHTGGFAKVKAAIHKLTGVKVRNVCIVVLCYHNCKHLHVYYILHCSYDVADKPLCRY